MITRSNELAVSPRFTTHPGVRLALIVIAAVAVYACDRATGPMVDPHDRWGRVLPTVDVTPGVTTLCQIGLAAKYEVRVGVTEASATSKEVSVPDGQCQVVANVDPASQDDVVVRIVEKEAMYYALDHILFQHGEEQARVMSSTKEVSFEGSHGALVTFFNNAAVTVCEIGAAAANFQYQIGLETDFQALTVADGQCTRIATIKPFSADDLIVTVRQPTAPAGTRLDVLTFVHGDGPTRTMATGASALSFEGLHGGLVTFRHVKTP